MAGSLRFEQGSRTHVGCVRTVNEDAYLTRERDAIWAVADGMGGHAKGRWASAQIVAALDLAPMPEAFDDAAQAARDAVLRANETICRAGAEGGRVIGSTVGLLIVRDRRFAVLWAGDSRVYRARGGRLTQLTTDHSQVEEMVAAGVLTPDEAETHPMAHVLSRAVGVRADLTLERRTGTAAPGDVFLLCSDGLTRMLDADEIAGILSRETPRGAAVRLVDLAIERGAPDNVTVVVVRCDETTLVAPERHRPGSGIGRGPMRLHFGNVPVIGLSKRL